MFSVDTKDSTSEPFDQLVALQQSAGKPTACNYSGIPLSRKLP